MLKIESIECVSGPAGLVDMLRDEPYMCFLDSSLPGSLGRWSFVAASPFLVMTMENGNVRVDGRIAGTDPYEILAGLLDEYKLPCGCEAPPFACGAAGFLSYDLGRYFESVPSHGVEDLPQPDLSLAFYDCTAAFDNHTNNAFISYLPSGEDKARKLLDRLKRAPASISEPRCCYKPGSHIDWSPVESNFTKPDYLKAVQRVREYIAAADVYQINLSQRFHTPFSGDPWGLYKTLRDVNPSPFGCFLDFPGLTLAGASPERLLLLDGETRTVETRPIKGTRPRGRDAGEDARLAAELRASEKDRAENVMIVDLERNDLGKVCEYGSVHVPSLWAIEAHPNVFQMVSTVQGRLAADKGPADLLAACFPGGSITGAPKIRAMQIIEELEPNRRGIYTGSVGYIDFRGNMDFNIIIRSIVLRDGQAYFHGGGGIVIDSVPENEYDETLDKITGLVTALEIERGR